MKRVDVAQRSARGSLWSMVEVWGTELLQFIVFAVLAQILGPQSFGLIALAMMLVVAAQRVLIEGGWPEFIIHRDNLDQLHLSAIFWTLLAISTAVAVFMTLVAPVFAWAFDEPPLAVLLPALSLYPILASLSIVPSALLERDLRIAPVALRWTAAAAVGGIIGVTMAWNGFGVWSLVAYEISNPLLGALILWPASGWRPQARLSMPHLRDVMHYVARVMGERLTMLAEILVARAAIGWQFNAVAVGNWSLASKIFELSAELVQRPALRVALPSFATEQSDHARLSEILLTAAELTALVAVPGYAVLLIIGPDLIATLFGEAWRPAGQALSFLAALGVITPLTQLIIALLQGMGQVTSSFMLALFGLALFLLMLPVGISYGVVGIAAVLLVRGWLLLVVRVWFVRRLIGMSIRASLKTLSPFFVAGVIMLLMMVGVVSTVHGSKIILLALAIAAGATSYIATLMLIARKRLVHAINLGRDAIGLGTGTTK